MDGFTVRAVAASQVERWVTGLRTGDVVLHARHARPGERRSLRFRNPLATWTLAARDDPRALLAELDAALAAGRGVAGYLASTRGGWRRGVAAVQAALAAGDAYQANLTTGFEARVGDVRDAYRSLSAAQPLPFGALLDAGDAQLASCSPELFFRSEPGPGGAGPLLTARPMKGTLPRRADPDADAAAAASLRRDPKSRAENVMIVDLLRHDLGRVALPGSVVVDDLLAVEAYRTGWQMTSTVRGVAGRLGVGGGILIDSDADAEWAEVAAKGRFPTHPAPPLGLFETMRWEGGTLQRWPRHRARMAAGAAAWGLPFDGEAAEATALAAVREALAGDPAAVRGPLRVRLDLREDGRLSARARPHPADDAGETVVVWSDRPIDADDPARRHKGLDRRAYDEANAWARAHGVADVLFCNRDGRLAEGAISNVFVLDRDGRWRTPPINDGALPGVLRGDLLDAGLAVEAPLRPADLQGATVAIGNALRGLRPVRIDPVRRWRPT